MKTPTRGAGVSPDVSYLLKMPAAAAEITWC
jgi:hypothetical protein